MNKNDEIILVTDREGLFKGESLTWQGANKSSAVLTEVMDHLENNTSTLRRGDAEENEALKQPIPYMVLKRGEEVFVYERLQGGGEQRLHNKLSLGVGGHMNPIGESLQFSSLLTENTMRELEEEVSISGHTVVESDLKIIALINDDSEDVGRVHLGLLGVIDLPLTAEVTVNETDQLKGEWIKIKTLHNDDDLFSRLENWSKIFIQSV